MTGALHSCQESTVPDRAARRGPQARRVVLVASTEQQPGTAPSRSTRASSTTHRLTGLSWSLLTRRVRSIGACANNRADGHYRDSSQTNDAKDPCASQWAAIESIAGKIGCTAET
jgi:hypothetical protein